MTTRDRGFIVSLEQWDSGAMVTGQNCLFCKVAFPSPPLQQPTPATAAAGSRLGGESRMLVWRSRGVVFVKCQGWVTLGLGRKLTIVNFLSDSA